MFSLFFSNKERMKIFICAKVFGTRWLFWNIYFSFFFVVSIFTIQGPKGNLFCSVCFFPYRFVFSDISMHQNILLEKAKLKKAERKQIFFGKFSLIKMISKLKIKWLHYMCIILLLNSNKKNIRIIESNIYPIWVFEWLPWSGNTHKR